MKNGSIRVVDMAMNNFLVHFNHEEDYKHALSEGSWILANHYLIVQRWHPIFFSRRRVCEESCGVDLNPGFAY